MVIDMKAKIISRERLREVGKKHGFKEMPKDHPFYSEGMSITFVSRIRKRPQRKLNQGG